MANLTEKISQLKDEHAEEQLARLREKHKSDALKQALFVLGRIKQNEHLATSIASNLMAQTIRALETFQKEKMFLDAGYTTFDEFLNDREFSPLSKRQYYDRLSLIREHGDEIYDLLTSIGISVRSQKLLGSGDLSIKNDSLYVGDKEVEIGNTGIIKDVLNELFDERRTLSVEKEKLEKTIEKQKSQIKTGEAENDRLQRNLDEIDQTPRFQRTLMHAVNSLLILVEAVGELDDDEKKARGREDLQLFADQHFRLADAYGVTASLRDDKAKSAGAEAGGDFIDRVLSDMDLSDLD